jgi:hypothetical protein
MVRNAATKVMWVGRATVFLVGLSVILALVFGVATTAMGANGNPFLLGKKNVASAISTLVNKGPGPALNLVVGAGQPPLKVNSSAQVTNLNADKVDGSDGELWAQINADGTADNWKGMTGNGAVGGGRYNISFNRDITECAYSATIADNGVFITDPSFIFVGPAVGNNNMLIVQTWNSQGVGANRPFHVVVFCGDHQSAP